MSTTKIAKSIAVFGGNGFLVQPHSKGRRICETATLRGYNVTSISSSGSQPKNLLPSDKNWVNSVKWTKGDVFKPDTYKEQLKGVSAVVHSIGILLENQDYKKAVRSNDDIFNEIQSFFTTSNPMKKNQYLNNTYDQMNTQSALILGESLIEMNKDTKPAFVYISADRKFPGVPMGYIESKRRAEYELYQLQPKLRPVFMRPGFMYDELSKESNLRSKIKNTLNVLDAVNEKLLWHSLDGIVRPPISTQLVAKWCIDKIEDDEFHGPVLLDQMINVKK